MRIPATCARSRRASAPWRACLLRISFAKRLFLPGLLCLAARLPAEEGLSWLRPTLDKYCVHCHGEGGAVESGVDLTALRSGADLHARPQLLERLVAALEDGLMPPEDQQPLPPELRERLVVRLRAALREASRARAFIPTPIRRMNRFQYNNAVVDLLELERDIFQLNERLMRRRDRYFRPETGVMPNQVRISSRPLSKDIDNERPEGFRGVAAFPQDKRAEHGFDNRADHLTLSPLLMEAFLELSRSIAESPDLNPHECRAWGRLFAAAAVDGHDAIRARLAWLLRRAFRRPVDTETIDRFAAFAESRLASGASTEETMRAVVGAVLAMPDFLYLHETVRPRASDREEHGRRRVDDFELATRLSQFFWSSIPDDTLLDLAETGRLSDPDTLSAQIERMMNDRKSSRFCDNFPAQWLQLDRLITAIPDPEKFPYFYYNGYRTSMHMMSEPLLLFETLYVENRSLLELLDPDFTWESEMLRANYEGHSQGARDVQVQRFKRVRLDDPRRGGVITNAAVLTMTSTPLETQPVTRGAWINAVIFNDPPDPPPADVPPLSEANAEELAQLTIRERLAAHRRRADCAACHDKIDPLGFALENYGPTGVWREAYENGREIDVSGKLFNRHEFRSVIEFKQLLLQEKQRFIRGFVSHLLSYALGRELGPADFSAVDEISERAVAGEDRMRTVLKRVAMSEPFLYKDSP